MGRMCAGGGRGRGGGIQEREKSTRKLRQAKNETGHRPAIYHPICPYPPHPTLLTLLSCSTYSHSHSSTAYSNCHTRALALANTTEIRLIKNP
jgi:hypothetical protein